MANVSFKNQTTRFAALVGILESVVGGARRNATDPPTDTGGVQETATVF